MTSHSFLSASSSAALKSLLLFATSMLLNACVSTSSLSTEPAADAPQLVPTGARDDNNMPIYRWDRPHAFANLTPKQQLMGDAACLTASSDLVAVGYHPQAKNHDGQSMLGGGYLCEKKERGGMPDVKAPQLVKTDGILGWDRPSAFGRVPASEKARGARICQSVDRRLVAVGFHPTAKGEQGYSIEGGGFFCGIPPTAVESK
jgi:hypothetical protein